MSFRSTFAKSALTGVAGVMALSAAMAVPTFASAQSAYDYQSGGYYDPCRRSSTNRGTAGALIGGALGAVIGSNAAARNARTEGALLGGALGAAAGGAVGVNSAACRESRQGRTGYYDNNYSYGSNYDRGAYDRDDYYRGGYAARYDDDDYDYDRQGAPYRVTERAGADGCTLAESPIYLPDGRVQKRFVRVCQDGQGNYQVVD